MSTSAVKVLGERNAGTNFLEQLLRANTSVPVIDNAVSPRFKRTFARLRRVAGRRYRYWVTEPLLDLFFLRLLRHQHGFKHLLVTEAYLRRCPGSLAIVAVTKDPYAWLWSLYAHQYHRRPSRHRRNETFGQFLREPWPTVRRELAERTYANPVELWNAKVRSYELLVDRPRSTVVRYESLIADIPATLSSIAVACELPLHDELQVPERDAKRAQNRSTEEIIEHYADRRFLARYNQRNLAFVNQHLDPAALALGGYELVTELPAA